MTSPGSAGRTDIDPLVVSVAEAARMLGISKTLAYGLVARQELPSVRVGGRVRVPRRALERLAEGRRENAGVLSTGARSAAPRRHRPPRPAPCSETGAGPASSPPPGPNQSASDSTTQLSLFEGASESPSPTKTRTRTKNQTTTTRMNTTKPSRTTTETTSTHPVSTTSTPDPYLLLTRSNEPDALAPGVRRGRVSVPGNGAGERSALNGNLNEEAGSGC
jgi:excisionase family DNA binding protein